ncbi:hypothetical protein LCGC14_1730260, partial [marine sediment metagenome]
FLKIRDYAEELLDGLNLVEWPEKVKIKYLFLAWRTKTR